MPGSLQAVSENASSSAQPVMQTIRLAPQCSTPVLRRKRTGTARDGTGTGRVEKGDKTGKGARRDGNGRDGTGRGGIRWVETTGVNGVGTGVNASECDAAPVRT